jgi:NADPH-dependent 2,4-dienoyl-CoA reductase/sulfur reductase-like enzyme
MITQNPFFAFCIFKISSFGERIFVRIKNKAINPNSERISFTFNGKQLNGLQGDTVASALIDSGLYTCRITDTGDQRGVYCGMGVCNECAVEVDGRSGELACMTYIQGGMNISTQKQARQLPSPIHEQLPERYLKADLLVIGAGPAGMSAAIVASKAGLDVVIVDERKNPGGQYFKQPSSYFSIDEDRLDKQFKVGRNLISQLSESKIKVLSGATIWSVSETNKVFLASKEERWEVQAKNILIAAGAYEKGIPIPGWTLPGVMTTGAAQTLLRSYQVALGEKIVISGNGPLNLQMAAELISAGVEVVALAETSKPLSLRNSLRSLLLFYYSPKLFISGVRYMYLIAKARVPFFQSAAASNFFGEERVESVEISKIDKGGVPLKVLAKLEVDSVALGFGFSPSSEIARTLGCAHTFDAKQDVLVANRDSKGRSSVSGIWIAGDSGVIGGAQVAIAEGTIAAFSILEEFDIDLPKSVKEDYRKALKLRKRSHKFQKVLWKIFSGPTLRSQLSKPDTVICRCLSLTKEEICDDLESQMRSAGALKRVNRAGMGKCQGRYCSSFVTHLIAESTGEPVGEFSGYAPATPFKPTAIGIIAYSPVNESSE